MGKSVYNVYQLDGFFGYPFRKPSFSANFFLATG